MAGRVPFQTKPTKPFTRSLACLICSPHSLVVVRFKSLVRQCTVHEQAFVVLSKSTLYVRYSPCSRLSCLVVAGGPRREEKNMVQVRVCSPTHVFGTPHTLRHNRICGRDNFTSFSWTTRTNKASVSGTESRAPPVASPRVAGCECGPFRVPWC